MAIEGKRRRCRLVHMEAAIGMVDRVGCGVDNEGEAQNGDETTQVHW